MLVNALRHWKRKNKGEEVIVSDFFFKLLTEVNCVIFLEVSRNILNEAAMTPLSLKR